MTRRYRKGKGFWSGNGILCWEHHIPRGGEALHSARRDAMTIDCCVFDTVRYSRWRTGQRDRREARLHLSGPYRPGGVVSFIVHPPLFCGNRWKILTAAARSVRSPTYHDGIGPQVLSTLLENLCQRRRTACPFSRCDNPRRHSCSLTPRQTPENIE